MYSGPGGGDIFSATYEIPTAFVPLCKRIGTHLGSGKNMRLKLLRSKHKNVAETLEGVAKLQGKNYNSPTMKQFERNLISLTNKFLDNKSTWIDLEKSK